MTHMEMTDLHRLEIKVDKLTEAVTNLVRVEERQMSQGQRLGAIEERVSAVEQSASSIDRKVDQWINRGIGMWALALVLLSLLKSWLP